MSTPQEIQRNTQFQQLLGTLIQVNEALVTTSSQLSSAAIQLLQIRQHLQQLKDAAPTPDHPGYPSIGEDKGEGKGND